MKMKEKNTVKKFFKSFTYAFEGLIYGMRTQLNMRFHISITAFMFFFLLKYDFFKISKTEFAVLILTCAAVLSLEYINTAVECAVDLASPEYSLLAKIAKDTAAAAVLISAIGAVVLGIVIMLQPEAFRAMGRYYAVHIPELAAVCVAIVLDLMWIFYPRKVKEK